MKKLLLFTLLLGMTLLGQLTPARAMTDNNLCGLKPFTAETHYMSLEGYMRYQHFQQQHLWLKGEQAVMLTRQQLRLCAVEKM